MKKERLSLYLAIGLPILLILAIAGLTFYANRSVRSQYDFVYIMPESPYYMASDCVVYKSYYDIDSSGHLEMINYDTDYFKSNAENPCFNRTRQITKDAPQLFYYDAQSDSVHPISFEDAGKYTFSSDSVSPDGYIVDFRYDRSGVFDIFGGQDTSGIYLTKKNSHRRLNIPIDEGAGYSGVGFKLIGWVNK